MCSAKKSQKPIPFQQVVSALLNDDNPFPSRYLYRLSDISSQELVEFKKIWPSVSLRRRQAVMEDLQEFNEDDFMLNFFDIGMVAVQDPDPHVRLMAILTLAEYEGEDLVPIFLQTAENDSQMEVRVAATAALGRLVELGELDELPASALKKVEACLIRIHNGQDAKSVRLSSLESLGYSSMDEVDDLIRNAFQSGDSEWVASALVAMGRSFDPVWNNDVLKMLRDPRVAVRQEAVRAAGELEILESVPTLKELLQDNEDTIRQAAIWSLSQIGGENVRQLFEQMLELVEDEDDEDFLESALENLEFTEGFPNLTILDLEDEIDEDELDED